LNGIIPRVIIPNVYPRPLSLIPENDVRI
jgi:hypothetical protein